jgi:hypothetical protein
LLIFFVVAFPVGTFVKAQRLARRGAQLETDDDAVSHARMWGVFFPGDYKDGYFWVRHLGWAVLVVICTVKEYRQVRHPSFCSGRVQLCVCPGCISEFVPRAEPRSVTFPYGFQASIGGSVGIAILVVLYMGILLKKRPFRKEHRFCCS